MESEEKVRGTAPAVLVVAVLLLALVPVPALAAEADGGTPPAYFSGDGRSSEPIVDPGQPLDVMDVKEIIQGKLPGEGFGGRTAGIGDVDNNGYDDIAVLSSARGHAVIYLGGPYLHESPVHPLSGSQYALTTQSQVRPAGDIDSDGFDDVIITAPDTYVAGMRSAGAIYILYGSPSGLSEVPEQVITGTAKDMRFGCDVDAVGDMDKDGYSDILVGADGWSGDTGLVLLYLGGPDGLDLEPAWIWEGEATGDRFGHAVSGAGDLNSDGWLDFAVGAPLAVSGQGKGRVYIFYGVANLGELVSGDVIPGRVLKSYFGLSIRLAGDVNNDGFSDLIISAPQDPSGTIEDPGRVELYLGHETGIQTDPVWFKQGESDKALFGFNIAFLGDVNRDGYDDVAIGAPAHTSDGKEERGKVYVFFGDTSGFQATPAMVEVGRQAGDQLSGGLAGAGDVDGDGFKDLLVGVPGADTNTGTNVGELHIYRGSDITMPPLQADAFEITDPEEGGNMLAEYRFYEFRLSVTHRTGLGALDHVDLRLDPEGEDVVLRFDQPTHTLQEISDRGDLAEGLFYRTQESTQYLDTTDILLRIKLHWGFPTGRTLSVRVEATDQHGLRQTGRWADTAQVVNRLMFSEPVHVTAADQGLLRSGDWVASSEELTFSGAMVEYDLRGYDAAANVHYYPPAGKVLVVVRDDTGGEWSQPLADEGPISIRAISPSSSRPEMTYTISIQTPDRAKVFGSEQITLNVDGTEVSFKNHYPTDPIASLRFTVSIEIEDPLGPGVHPYVEYQLDRAGDHESFDSVWHEVTSLTPQGDSGNIVAAVLETFTEGTNHIRWRASDMVGNGPTVSKIYPIVVDLGNITFSSPVPAEGTWHSNNAVTVGITIENNRANDIDLAHIQYRISTSPGAFSPWVDHYASVEPGAPRYRVTIVTQVDVSEGDDNYIQWRARDVERREYITSSLYRILVDMSGPVFSQASPSEDVFVNSPDVLVSVVVDDPLSGIQDSTIMYQVLGDPKWYTPLSRTHRGGTIECTARVSLREGAENYIRWQALDMVGHLSQPFDQNVKVDLSPPVVALVAPDPGEVVTQATAKVTVRVSDGVGQSAASGVDLRTLEYSVSRPSTEGYGPWHHVGLGTGPTIVEFALIEVTIELDDGDQNFIIWRVSDASFPGEAANTVQTEPMRIVADLPDVGALVRPVIVRTEPVSSKVPYGSAVHFSAGESYHPRGEALAFLWESDIDGVIGTSPSFSAHLSEGTHTITLRVTALSSNTTAVEAFHLTVGTEEAETMPLTALWEQVAMVLIVAFVATALLLRRMRAR